MKETTARVRGKTNGYSNATLRAKRNRKRQEAEERNEAWVGLTPKQQLASLKKRPGESKRQVERIKKLIETA